MITVRITFYLIMLMILFKCAPSKHCKKIRHYTKNVNTSKPFRLEGKYCIQHDKDTLLGSNAGLVRINIYNRIDGQRMNEGSVWFSQSIKFSYNGGFVEAALPEGLYNVNIYPFEPHLPFGIKGLRIKANRIIEINCFIGNSLQF